MTRELMVQIVGALQCAADDYPAGSINERHLQDLIEQVDAEIQKLDQKNTKEDN